MTEMASPGSARPAEAVPPPSESAPPPEAVRPPSEAAPSSQAGSPPSGSEPSLLEVAPPQSAPERLQRYQTRWGVAERVVIALISLLAAAAIPAAVDAYKTRLEIARAEKEIALKDKEIALKDKELEGKILEAHNSYTSNFLNTALNQDIELRMRFAEYFASVSDHRYKQGWEKFSGGLEKRRNDLRGMINQKERDFQKVRLRRTLLTTDEQTEVDQLERELRWYYAELGYVRQDSNVSSSVPRSFEDFGKGFNGPLVPVSAATLSNILGRPTQAQLPSGDTSSPPSGTASNLAVASSTTSTSASNSVCLPLDGPKLRTKASEYVTATGEKIDLIKPAAESLRRIMLKLQKEDPELANTITFVKKDCGDYNLTRKSFDVSSWLVTITLGGKFSASTGSFRLFGGLMSFPELFGADPFVLASLEKIARYFREEQWYWDVEDRIKRPNTFVVSASQFNKWVGAGEFK